ncbi:MAG: TadE/TadG family type IV pilus assembly protein [Actinomycetota bacterium]
MRRSDGGQSVAELALLLPVLVLLLLAVVQVGLVARDHVAVEGAARAAARAAALEPTVAVASAAASEAAPDLQPDRLALRLSGGRRSGDVLTVRVDYRSETDVPVVGRFIGEVVVGAEAAVRVE